MPKLIALSAVLTFAACESSFDVDMDEFEAVPRLDELDYSQIRPASSPDYWELRFSWGRGGPPDRVLGSGGTVQRTQLAAATRLALDSLRVESGLNPGCLPGYCFTYLAVVNNGSISTIRNRDALRVFLGTVDTKEEAALLVHAQGFYWEPDGEKTGARKRGSHWEFVALDLVRDCAPIQRDRVHLLIESNGRVRELAREVYDRDENACI